MIRAIVLATLMIVGTGVVGANLQTQAPTATTRRPEIEQVRDNLYLIPGFDPEKRSEFNGGNTAVFVTDVGVVVVDTKLPGWGPTILDNIKKVTDKPVIMILNTHMLR
jgi:glyoxylase-like metal-dependent hydrolase (beta-lactamase superfamily II)